MRFLVQATPGLRMRVTRLRREVAMPVSRAPPGACGSPAMAAHQLWQLRRWVQAAAIIM